MKILKEEFERIKVYKITPEIKQFRDNLDKLHYRLIDIDEGSITIRPDFNLKYLPDIYVRSRTKKVDIQTTSYGSLSIENYTEFLSDVNFAYKAAELIQDFLETHEFKSDGVEYEIRLDKESDYYNKDLEDRVEWI